MLGTGYHRLEAVQAILDKEAFTLEELLDEDDIIQECKSLNTRLVNFLKNPSTIASLIRFLVSEPPEDDAYFRYSYIACDIFSCELDDVFTTLLEDPTLMASLFSLLDKPPPLNSTLAGYFGRVVGSLLTRRPEKTHEYLQRHKELLPKLVLHIDSTSAVEIVLRMIGADELTSSMTPPGTSDWLAETDFMQLLLQRLCSDVPRAKHARLLQEAAQRNVAHIMVMLAGAQPNPLAEHLTRREYLRTMLDHASRPNSAVLRPILSVCIALLEPSRPPPMVSGGMSWGLVQAGVIETPPDGVRVDHSAMCAAVAEITTYLGRFSELLDLPGPVEAQAQPFGTLKPPLGRHRLTVVEFGKALLSTNLTIAVQAVISGNFVPQVMRLFQDFPFNNILHSYVVQILESLLDTLMPPMTPDGFNSDRPLPDQLPPRADALSRDTHSLDLVPAEDVLSFLIDTCNLLEWIVNLKSYVPPSSPHFEAASKVKPLQAAYEGHLTELANKLLHVAQHNDSVQAALDMNQGWIDFVKNVIEKRNHVQDADQWDVGRPPVDNTRNSSEGDEDVEERVIPLQPPRTFASTADDASLMPEAPIHRYPNADDGDANSLDSDNSIEEEDEAEAEGPPSHRIAGSDSDSDSSDGGDSGVYPHDADPEEPQTIEDEDVVELGDEASSPERTPREDEPPEEVADEDQDHTFGSSWDGKRSALAEPHSRAAGAEALAGERHDAAPPRPDADAAEALSADKELVASPLTAPARQAGALRSEDAAGGSPKRSFEGLSLETLDLNSHRDAAVEPLGSAQRGAEHAAVVDAGQAGPAADAPQEDKDFIATAFWKLPFPDVLEDELP